MSRRRLAVRGGNVVLEGGVVPADLIINEGRIQQIVGRDVDLENVEELDVAGQYVLPGLVDPHCHFNTFSHHADDLRSLSNAALAGGVTTIIPFLIPGGGRGQPETLAENLEHFIEVGREESMVDFSFHIALWPKWQALDEIERCVDLGCSSFKMFMALPRLDRMVPDDLLLEMMTRIGETGALAMTHAENGLVTDHLERRMIEAGSTHPTLLAASRPPEMEEEATFRAACLARVANTDLYVVHVTCRGAMDVIRRAREREWPVMGETCPQYLTLNEEAMAEHGALAKVAPPLRTVDDQEALWEALDKGWISSLGSDHSAHAKAIKENGAQNVFEGIPFGAATIETMLRLLFSEGVLGQRLSIERLVELTSRNPAKTFGLYPRKGSLQPGSDADLVVMDPNGNHRVNSARHKDRSGYSLYDGWTLKGSISHVIQGGRLTVDEEGPKETGLIGGEYIPRPSSGLPQELL